MNQFEFLSIFISIIIALGISNILTSAMRLIRQRGRARMHPPTLVWMAVLFLLQMLIWWAAFNRRGSENWTFFRFLLYLMMPILVSVPGYLLVPEIQLELEPGYDLEGEFNHNKRWFFGIIAAMVITTFVEYGVSKGPTELDLSTAFRLVFIALCVTGMAMNGKRAQLLIALAFLAALLTSIGLLFSRL